MLGLMYKDLMNLKKTVGVYGVFIGVYFLISFANRSASFFIGMLCILSVMLPITALSYDERAKWDRYALTMPVSRRDMVLSKYLLGLGFLIIGLLCSLLISAAFSNDFMGDALAALIVSSVGLFMISLAMPMLFKMGVEKGRVMMMVIFLLPTAIIVLLPKSGIPKPSEAVLEAVGVIWPIIVAVVWVISLIISIRIYAKKEF